MSKKILSEAQLRRFAKLANIESLNENPLALAGLTAGEAALGGAMIGSAMDKRDDEDEDWGGNKGDKLKHSGPARGEKKGDKAYVNEDAEDEIAMDAEEAGMGELPEPDEAELDDLGGEEPEDIDVETGPLDQSVAEDIAGELIGAIGDILGVEIEMSDAPEVVDDFEGEEEVAFDDESGEEVVDDIEIEDEEPIMEALRGINYVPGRKEIINEVAKRVAKRLLKAKQADRQLQEALGNIPRRATKQSTRENTSARRKVRATRNARRKTKK